MSDLLLLALAIARLSLMLSRETGPGAIFVRLRLAVGGSYDELSQEQPGPGFWSQLLTCIWCLSVWVAAGFSLFYLWQRRLARLVCLPLALSMLAIKVTESLYDQ